ncbi:MAG: hypothetical protein J5I47_10505 [Vicingus serpentipes]|nr:hypothetical protein [Vicingus serpentipes]
MQLKKWVLHKKITLAIALIGAIAGFLYWKFVGCASGSCAITAKWYTSTIYGLILGWLFGDILHEKINSPQKHRKD